MTVLSARGPARHLPLRLLNRSTFEWMDRLTLLHAPAGGKRAGWLRRKGDPIFGYELRDAVRAGRIRLFPEAVGSGEDGAAVLFRIMPPSGRQPSSGQPASGRIIAGSMLLERWTLAAASSMMDIARRPPICTSSACRGSRRAARPSSAEPDRMRRGSLSSFSGIDLPAAAGIRLV